MGGGLVVTSGQTSTTPVEKSFPLCTVSVFDAGTLNPSAIFSDSIGTAKANPFTAGTDASWFFYANSGRYDVKFSGTGILTPFTLSDLLIQALVSSQIQETSGPTLLTIGAIPDGTSMTRSGSAVIGVLKVDDSDARVNAEAFIGKYASLEVAVASIGATQTTLVVDTLQAVADDLTIPETLILRFVNTGGLQPATTKTITVLSDTTSWPRRKIFFNALAGQGTISFTGNKWPVFDLAWWGAVSDGATLDTAALTAAIAAVYTIKVGTIRIPAGITQISNIVFPAYSSAGNEGISITFEGVGQPPTGAGSFPGTLGVSTKSSIIRSTTAGASAMIAWAGTPFQAVSLTLKNLIIRREDDPSGPAVDATNGFGVYLENTIIDTGKYTTSVVQPTHAGAYGLILPGASNAGTQSIRGDCFIQGFYTGLSAGEHTTQSGALSISGCLVGLELPAGQLHPAAFGRIQIYNCPTIIKVTGSAYISISELAIEHANGGGVPAWQNTVWDVDDASNLAHGKIRYNVVKAFIGIDSTFTRNGGYFLTCDELQFESDKSTFVRNSANILIPDTTDTLLTFDTVDANFAKADLSTSSRIKPTQYGGLTIYACVSFAPNATGTRTLEIWKSHSAVSTLIGTVQVASAGAAKSTILALSTPASVNDPADYFFVMVRQTSGGNLNVEASVNPDFSSPRFIMRY